jgi:adenylyltransferase/sulfurtransferase
VSERDTRYSRFTALSDVGEEGLRRLRQAKVAVVGVGGLGCVSALQMASLGVGVLRIVDRDIVELSNLQRQHLYTEDDLGLPKVEAAQHRLQVQNPDVKVEAMALSVTEATVERIVKGMEIVIDGLDRFAPRYALNRACVKHNIPYVFAGALGSAGNITTIVPGKTPCLECFLGDVDDNQPTCATVGIYPTVLGVIGNLQVHETLRLILGKEPQLANTLLYFEIESLDFHLIPISQNKDCPVCGGKTADPASKGDSTVAVTELCEEDTFLVHARDPVTIDIGRAVKILKKDYKIISRSSLGFQLQFSSKVQVSVVGEGNILVKGVTSPEKAETIYHQIIALIDDALEKAPSS